MQTDNRERESAHVECENMSVHRMSKLSLVMQTEVALQFCSFSIICMN